LPAYVAVPSDVRGTAPVIILMHERYGFTDKPMIPQTERFAREGYVTIAPDFFYKHPDQEALHRGDLGYEMTDPESIGYLDQAVAFLKTVPQADLSRLAIMGVCQTGRHPLVYAAQRPLAAALVWYGAAQPREFEVSARYPTPLEEIVARIECPVLGHFGEDDHIISINDVRRLRNALEKNGRSFAFRIYRDAPHGWLNEAVLSPDYDRSRCLQGCVLDVSVDYDFSTKRRQA
jgi:carboxymethylenebutenolidase